MAFNSSKQSQQSRASGTGRKNRYFERSENQRSRRDFRSSDEAPKSPTKILQDRWQGDVVYGTSSVLAALDSNRRQLYAIYVQEGIEDSKRKEVSSIRQALLKAKALNIPLVTVSKHDINMVTNNRPHQGIVLDASPLSCEKMDRFPKIDELPNDRSLPLWLCLDEITDPQNLGAVIRSAYFLGATGVLICGKNSAPLSGVVSKASAGAVEKMSIYSCKSLPTTLNDARSKGWAVIGACADEESITCEDYDLKDPTILVMGSEGYGLRTTVRRACSASVRIARAPEEHFLGKKDALHEVDSLNVSVATGILLHNLLQKCRAT
jgi:21S rRNA (GM2251-2'-O)-methyltransferase